MADRWLLIDNMVSELGALYALEVEASNFPEISEEPAVRQVHLAVLRATDAVSRIAVRPEGRAVHDAREALESAREVAQTARRLLAEARAARNQHL